MTLNHVSTSINATTHSVEFSDAAGGYQCYGIYDGHWGTKAAKFTSRTLHAHIQSLWLDLADETLEEAVREVWCCCSCVLFVLDGLVG
jgi:serine/threonine protein phosphatase PrpC